MTTTTRLPSRTRNSAVATVLAVSAALLLGGASNQIQAKEQAPAASFQGIATIDGEMVPAGTMVSAWVRGEKVVETRTFDVDGTSVYSLLIPADNQGTSAVDGGRAEDVITFLIDHNDAQESALWRADSSQFLDINSRTLRERPPFTIAGTLR